MNYLAILLGIVIIASAWDPEGLGSWMAQVRRGYIKAMKKED